MTRATLLLLILPALCLAHSIHYRSPPPACPERVCVCSMAEGPTTKRQQRVANCKELPTERLTKTITSLTVSGQITKVTKKMIATLGGDLLSLDLSGCQIQTIEPGSFDGAPKLVKLKLSNNQMEEIGPGTFKKSKVLEELYLDGNRLKHIDESAFSKLEHLRELHLERNYLTQFPSKMPIGLTVLNVSQNNLGPELGCEIYETNIKELNLCGNHIERLTNTTLHALSKLQNLCVGDKAVHFPKNMATYLPHLSDLSLVAPTSSRTELDTITQEELAGMGTLTSLTIVNYKLQSLSFLHSLTKLRRLTLRDITIPEPLDFQSILLSKTSLTVLDLEDSHELVHTLLDKMQVLGAMSALRTIGFRNTSITHLASFDIPHNDRMQLDISENPLNCDCGFAWLKSKEQNTSVQHFLLNADDTKCAAPANCVGKKLLDVVNNLNCSSQDREIRDSNTYYSGGRPSGKPVSFPNHKDQPSQHWPPRQPHQDKWSSPPVKFPTHPDQGGELEFPTHPNQGGESEFPAHPDQGGELEFPTHPNQGGESEFPAHPNQGGESEYPVKPDQGSTLEFPTNTDQGGEIEFSSNPDQTESGTTIEPMVTPHASDSDDQSTAQEPEGVDTEHNPAPTSDSDQGTPEHMSVHDADTDTNDYGIVYIVLGSLLGLLILVGMILAIFYWHFKKTGGNKITPSSGAPSTIDGTPVEPTFQQLQHTEGSSLLKNVKK